MHIITNAYVIMESKRMRFICFQFAKKSTYFFLETSPFKEKVNSVFFRNPRLD